MNTYPIDPKDRPEFVGQIIEIFEDFLACRVISLANPEIAENDADDDAIIYGSDYGELQTDIEDLLSKWGLTDMGEQKHRTKAVNIIWDTDGETVDLPTEIEIPESMTDEEEISDYISKTTGYCHKGYTLESEDGESPAEDIKIEWVDYPGIGWHDCRLIDNGEQLTDTFFVGYTLDKDGKYRIKLRNHDEIYIDEAKPIEDVRQMCENDLAQSCLHQYYSTLKALPALKRRAEWFESKGYRYQEGI